MREAMKLGRRMSQCLFISYKQVDPTGKSRVSTVQALAQKLGEPGLDCFVDVDAVQEFTGITQAIAEGLERATALLLYFTADYSKSAACMAELRAAYIAAQQNGWKPSERIFVLCPESQRGDFGHLPVDLRDELCAFDVETVRQKLPARVQALEGGFGRIGFREIPRHYGRSLAAANRFVGREREMWDVHASLNHSQASQVTGSQGADLFQLHGMGGVGKSLLAEEYAIRYGAAYPGGIFWLQAHGSYHPQAPDIEVFRAACRDQFLQIAHALGLQPPQDADLGYLKNAISSRIRENKQRCLWIVDDMPLGLAGHLDDVRHWFMTLGETATLLTTRSREYSALGEQHSLDTLPVAAASDLLAKHGIKLAGQEGAVQDLFNRLGGHALSLDVAAAAIQAEGCDIASYLQYVDEDPTEYLDVPTEITRALPSGCDQNIIRSLGHSIDRLRPEGQDFLTLAAHLGPGWIRKLTVDRVFRDVDNLEQRPAERSASRGLAACQQYSLAKQSENTEEGGFWQVHAVTLDVVKLKGLPQSDRGIQLLDTASGALRSLLDHSKEADLLALLSLEVSQARFMVEKVDASSQESLIALLGHLGNFDHYRGNVSIAVQNWRRIYEINTHKKGPEHPDTLKSMNNLASTLSALGDHSGARELHERVLESSLRILGPEHPDTLRSMNNLALTLSALGDLSGARELHAALSSRRRWTCQRMRKPAVVLPLICARPLPHKA